MGALNNPQNVHQSDGCALILLLAIKQIPPLSGGHMYIPDAANGPRQSGCGCRTETKALFSTVSGGVNGMDLLSLRS